MISDVRDTARTRRGMLLGWLLGGLALALGAALRFGAMVLVMGGALCMGGAPLTGCSGSVSEDATWLVDTSDGLSAGSKASTDDDSRATSGSASLDEAEATPFSLSDTPKCAGDRCVVINEVTSQDDDDVELLNIGSEAVDLSGWALIDQPEDENEPWPIPAGTWIEPGEYLVFDNAEHFPFGLGNDDAIYLYNASGQLIDGTDWPDRDARVSWCRIPDGLGTLRTCSQRTFGEPNRP